MPVLPIDILENIVDASADYPQLLSSLSLASRMLTARTRVNMFHSVHLGPPKRPRDKIGRGTPTRCDIFLELCIQNPDLPLHVRVLVITESVWRPTPAPTWVCDCPTIVPVVRRLHNLKGFTFRTEGISVGLSPPGAELFSFILSKLDMEWIHLSDIRFTPGLNVFRVFMNAAPLRMLSIADFSINLSHQRISDLPGYIPARIDTLAVSFDVERAMEGPFIRNALQRTRPLFDMDHIRCLRLDVYHCAEDMDRVHAWLYVAPCVEELEIRIVPGNQALQWRNRQTWKNWVPEHFESSSGVHMHRLQTISFRVRGHDEVGKIATVLQFIALAERLTHVTIHFTNARGSLTFLDEKTLGQLDDALAQTSVFPLLERIEILFKRNLCCLEKFEKKFGCSMPKTVDMLRIMEVS